MSSSGSLPSTPGSGVIRRNKGYGRGLGVVGDPNQVVIWDREVWLQPRVSEINLGLGLHVEYLAGDVHGSGNPSSMVFAAGSMVWNQNVGGNHACSSSQLPRDQVKSLGAAEVSQNPTIVGGRLADVPNPPSRRLECGTFGHRSRACKEAAMARPEDIRKLYSRGLVSQMVTSVIGGDVIASSPGRVKVAYDELLVVDEALQVAVRAFIEVGERHRGLPGGRGIRMGLILVSRSGRESQS
ncbi:hypothetical protein NE237_028418 [Protea cynaroides]|uniref:Uncharacterized protein n=1 Tax=Protea cynaroides TaxID=273540 RepID=A0A9Q0JTU4_9MAGN|nr:hypothetical protein NE237_028418 [Protea cynaroides]